MTADNAPKNIVDSIFDEFGRPFPRGIKGPVHIKTRRRFIAVQPEIDYAQIHQRINAQLGGADTLSVAEFTRRAKAILADLGRSSTMAAVLKGVHVPFFLPKVTDASPDDIGQDLQERYLKAVERSFVEKFPQYSFTNHHKDSLAGGLCIAAGSRHERLLSAARKGPVVGIYFLSLLEYSVPAAIEQMASLPECFLLAGGIDTCATLVGSPDLLLRTDGYPPLIWLASLGEENPGAGYYFEAYGYNLTFNRRMHFGDVAEYWSSGLVVVG